MSESIESLLIKDVSARHMPEVLYHYTSASGLLGILQSRSMWMTSIRFSNDSTEYNLALELAREVIQERAEKARYGLDRGLYNVLEQRLTAEAHAEVYVSSFTENGDQLSQWRAYCPATGGYSLGFISKSLIQSPGSVRDRFLVRCIYDPDTQEKLIRKLVQGVAQFVEGSAHHLGQDRVFREAFKLLGRLLPLIAPALKDPGFAEEEEWRLVREPVSFEAAAPRFREGRSMLIPYYEHLFGTQTGPVPLEEVVIGPTPHPELARDAAQALLSSFGLRSATVRLSDIPYRTW